MRKKPKNSENTISLRNCSYVYVKGKELLSMGNILTIIEININQKVYNINCVTYISFNNNM